MICFLRIRGWRLQTRCSLLGPPQAGGMKCALHTNLHLVSILGLVRLVSRPNLIEPLSLPLQLYIACYCIQSAYA